MPAAAAATENPEEHSTKESRNERQPLHLQEDPRVRLTRKSARIIDEIQKGDATYAEIIESALHICYESGLFREFHPRSVLALMEELRSAIQAHNAALVACHQLATQIQMMGEDLLICESLDRDLEEFMAKQKAWLVASKGQGKSGEGSGAAPITSPAKPPEAPKRPAASPSSSSAVARLAANGLKQAAAASAREASSSPPSQTGGQPEAGAQRNQGSVPEIE